MVKTINDPAAYGDYGYLGEALPGLIFGTGAKADGSYVAQEIIYPGRAVVTYPGDSGICGLPHADTSTIVYDADFVTLNSIAFTVAGVAITPVVFDTDQATTINALVAAIEGLDSDLVVTLTDTGGDNRTIAIFKKYTEVVVTSVVTLGATQAVATVTISSAAKTFLGVAIRVHNPPTPAGSVVMYNIEDVVNVREIGDIVGETDGNAVNDESQSAIVYTPEADAGKFTAYATSDALQLEGFYRGGYVSRADLKVVSVEAKQTI